jgi:hypothetical protein
MPIWIHQAIYIFEVALFGNACCIIDVSDEDLPKNKNIIGKKTRLCEV